MPAPAQELQKNVDNSDASTQPQTRQRKLIPYTNTMETECGYCHKIIIPRIGLVCQWSFKKMEICSYKAIVQVNETKAQI